MGGPLVLRALQSLGSSSLLAARASTGGLVKLSGALNAGSSTDSQQQTGAQAGTSALLHTLRQQRASDMMEQLRFNTAAVMAAKKDEEQPRQQLGAPVAGLLRPSAMPLLPARARLNRPAFAPIGTQRRAYNAWSPAQRYFVEGDHVIQAEANRTLQFTGLDSGSFYPLVVYTVFATAVSAVFMVLPLLIAPQRVDLDKSSAYECGFDAFGEARQTFSVSFYLVSIMYLLFDIEIAYLFPYIMTQSNTQMFWTMNLFLGLLVVGFAYEWGVGALEWRE